MRTEYMLTDAQKARIKQINDQIIALNIELAGIYAMARIRCVTESQEDVESLYRYMTFGEPLIKHEGIVKLNFGGCDDDRGTEKISGGEP